MNALVTIEFTVPLGHLPGDYAQLHSNGGTGPIDWTNPVSSDKYGLFPAGAGNYGFGHAPFGHHRFGRVHSMRTRGFGHAPFGRHPFGHGAVLISARDEVFGCGIYRYGFKCFDKAANPHTGTPDEATILVATPPAAPTALSLIPVTKRLTSSC